MVGLKAVGIVINCEITHLEENVRMTGGHVGCYVQDLVTVFDWGKCIADIDIFVLSFHDISLHLIK